MSLVPFRVVFEVQNESEMSSHKVRMKSGQIPCGIWTTFVF